MADAFVIGIDFGTLSARAVLVDARNGRGLSTAVHEYASGVIEGKLPGTKTELKAKSALQDPADYLAALEAVVPAVLRKAKARAESVVGIGTDFTSCTVLPVKSNGTPLTFDRRFAKSPHAWVKLWKHHATQPEADTINELGRARGEEFVRAYGGKYSSEWFYSKVLETVREAPEVYEAADFFIEGGDWIVWQLTGEPTRNVSAAGFKGMRVQRSGEGWEYPSEAFFRGLHPKLENVVDEKLPGEVIQLGERAGGLTAEMARRLKLREGIAVAAGNIDAHAGVPACGVTRPGTLAMIMGTSTCHLLMSEERVEAEGICGVVLDGIVPGYWGYEAGQSGVGDLFAWYVEHGCPRTGGKDLHAELSKQAAKLRPGESGLLALDWWNGNRSILVNADLTGVLMGLTIQTRPHEIYRALIEATAFGTRKIVEAFTNKGVEIRKIVASGGLAQKNPVLMQIYADVLQRPIEVAAAHETSALGAAMWGTVAAGVHKDIHAAAKKMVRAAKETYRPERRHKDVYDSLYAEYSRLHDLFGRDEGSSMRKLRELQLKAQR
ncbi:MAG TPA: ribulokinase [Verrucomicrobiae bacterium]